MSKSTYAYLELQEHTTILSEMTLRKGGKSIKKTE